MNVVVILMSILAVATNDKPAAAPPSPPANACASAEHHQFDFWIGKWDVFDAKSGERAGASVIEQLYGGCVIRENWSERGFEGGSLNTYYEGDHQWHQTWMDQAGALREFSGGIKDGKMVIVARQASKQNSEKFVLVRLTYTANKDGSVRQYSDYSKDDGATWNFRYDYVYRRAH